MRGRLRRLEEGDTMILYLGDRRRLVPGRVVDAEGSRCDRRRTKARPIRRRVREWRHHVPRAGTVNALLRRNHQRRSDSVAYERIGAGAERHERVEILGRGDVLEQIDRRKNRGDQFDRSLPREPLWEQTRPYLGRLRQPGLPAPRGGEVREGL